MKPADYNDDFFDSIEDDDTKDEDVVGDIYKTLAVERWEESGYKHLYDLPKRFFKISTGIYHLSKDYADYSEKSLSGERVTIETPDECEWGIAHDKFGNDRKYYEISKVLSGDENIEPLFPSLKIDLNGYKIEQSVLELINTLIVDGDIKLQDLWLARCTNNHWNNKLGIFAKHDFSQWMSFLKGVIPARIVDDKEMEIIYRSVQLPKWGKGDDNISKTQVMEALGCYHIHEQNSFVKHEIAICLERIKEVAKDPELNITEEHLFVIVYLHELAHAMLDESISCEIVYNAFTLRQNNSPKNDKLPTSLYSAMEESLANMIMLKILDWYAEAEVSSESISIYEDAIKFVEQQTPEYKFGIMQFNADVDYSKWRTFKVEIDNSDKSKKERLQKWFDKCFDDEGIRNNLVYTSEDYNKVFE